MSKRVLLILGLILSVMLSPFVVLAGNNPPSPTPLLNQEEMNLPGLEGEVTIHFDVNGVPHIYASTPHDLVFAQGYVQAQDRWWEMEWARHTGLGRLAEIAGADYAPQDTFFRMLGLHRNAQNDLDSATPEYVGLMQAFADGVNAYLGDKAPADLAVEYTYLSAMGNDMTIEPWQPLHSQVWLQVMSAGLALGGLEDEILRQGLIDAGGPLAPLLLMPDYPYDKMPLIMEPGWTPVTAAASEINVDGLEQLHFIQANLASIGALRGAGSNNWVLSGEMTESGAPLLANDPHLPLQIPAIWYTVGLHCTEISAACPYDVVGVALPAAPFVVIGHNQHIGWGMTNVGTDVVDLYLMDVNPENPNQITFNGEMVDLEVQTEIVNVFGGDPIEISVRISPLGPVFDDVFGNDLGQPVAVHWGAEDANRTFLAVSQMNAATNWEEFQAALTNFDTPAQNLVYADVEGNIGYVMTGRVPIRAEGHDGKLPISGADETFMWQGYVDPMDNPRLFNPESGYIVSANNAVLRPDEFPEVITFIYDNGYRAAQIETRIQAEESHNLDTLAAIQMDSNNPAAAFLVPALLEAVAEDEALLHAADWLTEWDYQNRADSPYAVLFNTFWKKLMPLVFDELPFIPDGGDREVLILSNMVGKTAPLWRHTEIENADEAIILKMAFEEAYTEVTELYGVDPANWRWGDLHQAVFTHDPLGQLVGTDLVSEEVSAEIDALFNRSLPVSGSTVSPNSTHWYADSEDYNAASYIPSMRMIYDFSDLDNSRHILPTGQSGDPHSPHYADQMPKWATGEYNTLYFTPAAVEANVDWTLVLKPE